MEPNQPTEQPNQVPPISSQSMSSPASVFEPKSSKLATIFLVFISIFSLFGLFYFYLQTQLLKQQLSSLQTSSNYTESTRIIPKPTLTPSASPAVDSPLFQIKELSLTFQLPVKLLKKGNWETITLPSDTGNNICFHLLPSTSWLVKSVKAGGVGICSGKYLTINSVSSDFTAGRGGSFTDISGYHIKDGQYFLGLDNSEGERPLTTNSPKEVATSNGLKYLFITGESIDNPGQLLPDKYVGALINTSNPKYPGIVIAMELSDQLTVVDFSQILDTLKFE